MDKKELFQKRVETAVICIADYMIANSQNGIFAGRSETIRKALKLNIYVYNEASGRLRAIGFHNGVKHFNKTQISNRTDGQKYYYNLNVDRHPKNILSTEEGTKLLNKRQSKLENEKQSDMEAFLTYFNMID